MKQRRKRIFYTLLLRLYQNGISDMNMTVIIKTAIDGKWRTYDFLLSYFVERWFFSEIVFPKLVQRFQGFTMRIFSACLRINVDDDTFVTRFIGM